jgi:hypothetical protein
MRVVLFCTTANSKANAVYNVLHIPEEDVILKYSDDKLEEKLNEVKEEQKNRVNQQNVAKTIKSKLT